MPQTVLQVPSQSAMADSHNFLNYNQASAAAICFLKILVCRLFTTENFDHILVMLMLVSSSRFVSMHSNHPKRPRLYCN
jgi:hypothetical protein